MSIKLKINLLLTLSLLFFAICISIIVTYFISDSKHAEYESSLVHAEKVFYEFMNNRTHNLKTQTELIAELPILSVVVENGDPSTCLDSSRDYQKKLNSIFFDLFDFDAELLASAGLKNNESDLSDLEPQVLDVLETGQSKTLLCYRNNKLVEMALVPIGNRDDASGVLVSGFIIDSPFLKEVAEHSGADLVLSNKNKILETTLSPEKALSLFGKVSLRWNTRRYLPL